MTDKLVAHFTLGGGELAVKVDFPYHPPVFLSLVLWSTEDYWTLLIPGEGLLKSTPFPSAEIEAWMGGSPLLATLRTADLHHHALALRDAIGRAVHDFHGDKEAELNNIADPLCADWSGPVPEGRP